MKLIGSITKITTKSIYIQQFHHKEFWDNPHYAAAELLWQWYIGAEFTLGYERDMIDDLLEHAHELCRFTIVAGVVIDIEPIAHRDTIIMRFNTRGKEDDDSTQQVSVDHAGES